MSKPILITLALIVIIGLGVLATLLLRNEPSAGNVTETQTTTGTTKINNEQPIPPVEKFEPTTEKPFINETSSTDINFINKTSNMITIETNHGTIVFETYNQDAPNTVANFIKLASNGFYDNLTFHRVIPGFMIQGGDPNGNGTGGPGYQFADELNPNTPSYKEGYKKGVVAMANAGPNTNGSQFFIMTADYPLPHDYTIFGKVVSGQDVVDAIANVPTGRNDRPVEPVVMKTVKVE
ncbi:MAG TPA: peptidylprolyl isomerase [bacterium]|nr:peptidylprolyl isomerase [bacterium]